MKRSVPFKSGPWSRFSLAAKLTFSVAIFIAATAALFAFMSAGPLAAQEKWPWGGTIDIWHSNALHQNEGYTAYEFTVDAIGLSFDRRIEDLVVTTDQGEIAFERAVSGSSGDRYGQGRLTSHEDFHEVVILKAVGKCDGKLYDLTDIIDILDFAPLTIRKK
ncbi:MAG: hypothetical protein LBJ61_09335 [Deltaproteobacteria bacterium]|jgi:hypothetical protein|nr:hypothetical protein [Deltaproteobacteria bacterium]